MCVTQEKRKKEREIEEKRLAAERGAEEERRKAAEVDDFFTRPSICTDGRITECLPSVRPSDSSSCSDPQAQNGRSYK